MEKLGKKTIKNRKKFRRSFPGSNGEEFNLDSYLFESANILRGNIDASDFKAYIFPLLFYKRISDVYDEEFQKALKESDQDEEYALSEVNHRFQIPKGCHWEDLRHHTQNIGQILQKTLRNIEKANPDTLFGIFGDVNWGNKEKITDELMINIIEHFSKVNLANSKIKQDILGNAYEYLIKKFADLANKKAGEFYTPRTVIKLLTNILNPRDNETIYDPACGTGGMLLEVANQIKMKGQDVRKLKLYGQESNMNTAAIARINLFLHGFDDFKLVRKDTLREPAFLEGDKLKTFDCVLANPPFSLKEWGYEVWKNDPFGRQFAGLPPRQFGDLAWLQHMISSIKKDTGRVGLVLSSAALFRKQEKKIRQKLVQMDYIVAIIQLAPDIFYGATNAPSILILKKKKSDSEKNKIFMINASTFYTPTKQQNLLEENHVDEIFGLYKNRTERKHISKTIPRNVIEKEDWNLSVVRYIQSAPKEKILPIKEVSLKLNDILGSFQKSNNSLNLIIKKYGAKNV